MSDMKKLIESIDRLSEAVLPPNHPDWKLSPQERIARQNARIAADSAADAEVWHRGLKPAGTIEPPKTDGEFVGGVHRQGRVKEDGEECPACNGSGIDPNGDRDETCIRCGGSGVLDDDDSLTEELRQAFEDYVSNEKYDNDHLYPSASKVKKPGVDKKKPKTPKAVDPNLVAEAPQSMKQALDNALTKAEPGSKLDKKIRHHNDMVRRFGKGTLTTAPSGYHLDKKGMIRLGEGYTVSPGIDRDRYTEIPGLEGPFRQKNGKVLYYDPKAGKYYDRDTDMYVEYDDYQAMNEAGVGNNPVSEYLQLLKSKGFKKAGKMQNVTVFTHPALGEIHINNYGEWEHLPHGSDVGDGFGGTTAITLSNHLGRLNESTDNDANPYHRVMVTVTDPNASAVSQRKEPIMKRIRVKGDKEEAVKKAIAHYKKQGYRVLDAEYIEGYAISEPVTELSDNTLSSYREKALPKVIPALMSGDKKTAAKRANGAGLAKSKQEKLEKIKNVIGKLRAAVDETKAQMGKGETLDEAPVDQLVAQVTGNTAPTTGTVQTQTPGQPPVQGQPPVSGQTPANAAPATPLDTVKALVNTAAANPAAAKQLATKLNSVK